MSNTTDNMTEADARQLEALYKDAADAKRAPELAVWILVLGPVPLDTLVRLRSERVGCSPDYARMSVMYDLGRIAGQGGPVEYREGLFYFNDQHRRAVLEWLYNSQVEDFINQMGRVVLGDNE